MLRLPIMVAAGGVNSAGRTSRRHAYKRMVWDSISAAERTATERALGQMMGTADNEAIARHTLIREIEPEWFDHRAVSWHRRAQTLEGAAPSKFVFNPGGMVDGTVLGAISEQVNGKSVTVSLAERSEVLLPSTRPFEVSAAGQLPSGFDPGALYPSRNHPRAVQMAIFAMSDALADLGMDWSAITAKVPGDAISVYVSSAMGQLDEAGTGGMLRSRLLGRRVSSKQCPFGFEIGRAHV